MLSTIVFDSFCDCIADKSADGITFDADKVAIVDGSLCAGIASTTGFLSKLFRFILVKKSDFPHQIDYYLVQFGDVSSLFCSFISITINGDGVY